MFGMSQLQRVLEIQKICAEFKGLVGVTNLGQLDAKVLFSVVGCGKESRNNAEEIT